jgi:hypothetical protein
MQNKPRRRPFDPLDPQDYFSKTLAFRHLFALLVVDSPKEPATLHEMEMAFARMPQTARHAAPFLGAQMLQEMAQQLAVERPGLVKPNQRGDWELTPVGAAAVRWWVNHCADKARWLEAPLPPT